MRLIVTFINEFVYFSSVEGARVKATSFHAQPCVQPSQVLSTVHEMGLRTLVNLEVAEFRKEDTIIGQALEVRNSQFICAVQ